MLQYKKRIFLPAQSPYPCRSGKPENRTITIQLFLGSLCPEKIFLIKQSYQQEWIRIEMITVSPFMIRMLRIRLYTKRKREDLLFIKKYVIIKGQDKICGHPELYHIRSFTLEFPPGRIFFIYSISLIFANLYRSKTITIYKFIHSTYKRLFHNSHRIF